MIGRPEAKAQAGSKDSWLAGRRAGQGGEPESKKVFSFKSPKRTFGFVKPGDPTFVQIKETLKSEWDDLKDEEFVTGDEILEIMLGKASQT